MILLEICGTQSPCDELRALSIKLIIHACHMRYSGYTECDINEAADGILCCCTKYNMFRLSLPVHTSVLKFIPFLRFSHFQPRGGGRLSKHGQNMKTMKRQ